MAVGLAARRGRNARQHLLQVAALRRRRGEEGGTRGKGKGCGGGAGRASCLNRSSPALGVVLPLGGREGPVILVTHPHPRPATDPGLAISTTGPVRR